MGWYSNTAASVRRFWTVHACIACIAWIACAGPAHARWEQLEVCGDELVAWRQLQRRRLGVTLLARGVRRPGLQLRRVDRLPRKRHAKVRLRATQQRREQAHLAAAACAINLVLRTAQQINGNVL
eukprot:COSAG01_NODE_7333_length_3246_cov_582.892596_6_plen_125_part_00